MHTKKRSEKHADILLYMVAMIWGGGFAAGKIALGGLSPVAILMYRFVCSAVILGIVFHRRIRQSDKKVIQYGLLLGVIQFAGLYIQLFALQYTTSAKQSFLAATYVIFTPLVVWAVHKTRPLSKDVAAAAIAIVGVGLISLGNHFSIQLGDPLTLGFALVFALQIVLTGKYAAACDIMQLTFFQFVSSGLLAAVLAAVTKTEIISMEGDVILAVLYIAFINTALAICLQNFAQRHAKASHVALILSLESVFGFIFSVLIFTEVVTLKVCLGCALVMAAICISNGWIKKQQTGK